MDKKALNRLKIVLAENGKTNKWLAQNLNKNETTISRWCTNEMQPSIEAFYEIAHALNVDVRELFVPSKLTAKKS